MKALHKLSEMPSVERDIVEIDRNEENGLEKSIAALKRYLANLSQSGNQSFEEHEGRITQLAYAIGREALIDCLQNYDESKEAVKVEGKFIERKRIPWVITKQP